MALESFDPEVSIDYPAPELSKEILGSCVKFARFKGIDIPFGTNANMLQSNSGPHIGAGILFRYQKDDHIAVIVAYVLDGFLVEETNFKTGQFTRRVVDWNDRAIRGFHFN